ncbi:hypothetical protein, partial [Dyella sp.]|uniref:hypothetical protein n=1 Tax=Dyella sp. TaxID=1869338 RepID=UPI002FD8A6DC
MRRAKHATPLCHVLRTPFSTGFRPSLTAVRGNFRRFCGKAKTTSFQRKLTAVRHAFCEIHGDMMDHKHFASPVDAVTRKAPEALWPSFPRKRESILRMHQSKMDSRFRALLSGENNSALA